MLSQPNFCPQMLHLQLSYCEAEGEDSSCFVAKALANGGIFSGIFLGIFVEMVLAGLRDGYS